MYLPSAENAAQETLAVCPHIVMFIWRVNGKGGLKQENRVDGFGFGCG
jgi:hypothetical protein